MTLQHPDGHGGTRTPHWGTPQRLFDALAAEFGGFDLDPCARDEEIAKCVLFFDEAADGLQQDWFGRVFLNPPYGNQCQHWMKKAVAEIEGPQVELIVALIPARVDTRWFHRLVFEAATELRFIENRISFTDYNQTATTGDRGPTFASCLAIYRAGDLPRPGGLARVGTRIIRSGPYGPCKTAGGLLHGRGKEGWRNA